MLGSRAGLFAGLLIAAILVVGLMSMATARVGPNFDGQGTFPHHRWGKVPSAQQPPRGVSEQNPGPSDLPEIVMAGTYGVAQGTGERAVRILKDEGLVRTVIGKGVYVKP